MTSAILKKTILEIVNNQLKENNPPCTKRAYEDLLDDGYTEKEAKDKIGAVVLEEIYDVMKENKPFDEILFENALNNMVQQCIDMEEDHELPAEWDDIGDLIDKGQSCLAKRDYPGVTAAWLQAWQLTKDNVKQAEFPIGIYDLDEATDYEYNFEAWLQDMEMELSNAQEHEKRITFCQEVLDAFIWKEEDYGGFKVAIGESFYALGKKKKVVSGLTHG